MPEEAKARKITKQDVKKIVPVYNEVLEYVYSLYSDEPSIIPLKEQVGRFFFLYFIEGRVMQLPKKYLFLNFELVSGVSSDFPRQSLRRNIRYSTVLYGTYHSLP
jgi:hypothetical protein